jgi:hypothetical protein
MKGIEKIKLSFNGYIWYCVILMGKLAILKVWMGTSIKN